MANLEDRGDLAILFLRDRIRHLERELVDWKTLFLMAFMGGLILGCVGTVLALSYLEFCND